MQSTDQGATGAGLPFVIHGGPSEPPQMHGHAEGLQRERMHMHVNVELVCVCGGCRRVDRNSA